MPARSPYEPYEMPVRVRGVREKQSSCITTHPFPKPNPSPLKYSLVGASTVGSYAMQLQWGDGHSTGIYTWEHLRSLCECPECLLRRRTA